MKQISCKQRVISVMWPSFLTSAVATMLFFVVFDPETLVASGMIPPVSALGAYTIGFFASWALTAGTCMLTCYFSRPCETINGDAAGA